MNHNFKHGDRVQVNCTGVFSPFNGMIGTVIGLYDNLSLENCNICVEFDKPYHELHDGFSNIDLITKKGIKGKDRHCYYIYSTRLKKLNKEFWMVLKDGSEYIKKRHETLESAQKEAERLAESFLDSEFYVLHCVDTVIKHKPKLKYKQINTINGRILSNSGACEKELIKFVNNYGFDNDIKVDQNFIEHAERQDGWIDYLLKEKFIVKNI